MNFYNKLINKYTDIIKLSSANTMLTYDSQVSIPHDGFQFRSRVCDYLTGIIAKKMKSKSFLEAIHKAKSEPLSDDNAIILREIENEIKFQNRIPVKLQIQATNGLTNFKWEQLKKHKTKKCHEEYIKQLAKYIDVFKKIIECGNKGEFATPYDYLLDDYSWGLYTADIQKIFDLIAPVLNKAKQKYSEPTVVKLLSFDKEKLMPFMNDLATFIIGKDTNFKLNLSTHPFCSTIGQGDIRISTRITQNSLDNIYSTIHEAGHASYETYLNSNYYGFALGNACSIAAHEGISLFHEIQLGNSYEMIKKISSNLSCDENDIRQYLNSVNLTNPVRVESDEITYQQHIINRFTIEKEIFNGNLKVSDLHERWNELYGVNFEPHMGYAQDVHWSCGNFGYFPSYTIGHLIAAQLRNTISNTCNLDFNKDDVQDISRDWLISNYYTHGMRYDTKELIKISTGEELNPNHWINYIKQKYSLD